jgi:pyruvate ferredoxin oxidoreductase gamma subunit
VFETRIHGRGGQGVVTAADVLSLAAFDAGRHAQAFPSFGSERTGAPVVSYCRISSTPIRTRQPILAPHALIIADATLLMQVDVFAGLGPNGYVLVNTRRSFEELGLAEFLASHRRERLATVPATEISLRNVGRPVPNASLLGGFAALTGQIGLTGIEGAFQERFGPALGAANAAASEEAYAWVKSQLKAKETAHAATD